MDNSGVRSDTFYEPSFDAFKLQHPTPVTGIKFFTFIEVDNNDSENASDPAIDIIRKKYSNETLLYDRCFEHLVCGYRLLRMVPRYMMKCASIDDEEKVESDRTISMSDSSEASPVRNPTDYKQILVRNPTDYKQPKGCDRKDVESDLYSIYCTSCNSYHNKDTPFGIRYTADINIIDNCINYNYEARGYTIIRFINSCSICKVGGIAKDSLLTRQKAVENSRLSYKNEKVICSECKLKFIKMTAGFREHVALIMHLLKRDLCSDVFRLIIVRMLMGIRYDSYLANYKVSVSLGTGGTLGVSSDLSKGTLGVSSDLSKGTGGGTGGVSSDLSKGTVGGTVEPCYVSRYSNNSEKNCITKLSLLYGADVPGWDDLRWKPEIAKRTGRRVILRPRF